MKTQLKMQPLVTTLFDAVEGVTYRITAFTARSHEHLRLMELGFQTGSEVTLVQRAPLHGLLKVKVKETRFAICDAEAKCIVVEPIE